MGNYTPAFKSKILQKMMGPNARSASVVAAETGLSQPTLSRWLRLAKTGASEMKAKSRAETSVAKPVRPAEWKAEDRLRIVVEASRLSEADLGAFLRSEGLYEASLTEWREAVLGALRGSTKASPEVKRIRELEKELLRKDKALAETAALLVLKKKAQAIWGDADDDTTSKSGE